MNELERAKRNLNPHKAATAAMFVWSRRYSMQRGGSMDFWDALSESEREICRDLVLAIHKAPDEPREPQGESR